jgi:hypothetical protein
MLLVGMLAILWSFSCNGQLECYVLCSESNNIYTVDESRPRVECLSVRGSRIIDTGNFGMFPITFLIKQNVTRFY